MTQAVWTCYGWSIDAASILGFEWNALKQTAQLGDFVIPCYKVPTVLRININDLSFFAYLLEKCRTLLETKWYKSGKPAVIAALTDPTWVLDS